MYEHKGQTICWAGNILFALDGIGLVRLDTHQATADQLSVVNDVACLRGQHGLYVVVHVAQDNAIPLTAGGTRLLVTQRLNLQALKNGHGELLRSFLGIGEDDTRERGG